jgi:hypothetical protein
MQITTLRLVSGSPVKNVGSTFLYGGSGSSNVNSNTYSENLQPSVKTTPKLSTSNGVTSGVAGRFANDASQDPISVYQKDEIAGQTSSYFTSATSSLDSPSVHAFSGDTRLNITAWSLNGVPTYGGSRGAFIPASGIDGRVGKGADDAANPTLAVPGEYTIMINGKSGTNLRFSART